MRSFNKKGLTKKSNNSPSPTILKSPEAVMTASLGNPFTSVQLRELERQIMIYKYFMASVTVPSYLLSSIPTSPSTNIADPVEGRCRRTDGKKWRCSRYVAPDNKYCERHMHRGSRRSRKQVELQTNHTRKLSSHFLTSTVFHPYLEPSLSFDNSSFGVKLAPSFDHSNKQPWMLNGDPMSLGGSNSGWHNNIPVNHYTKSLPQYNTLLYDPLLVPKTTLPYEKPRGIQQGESSFSSFDQSMMGPLGEIIIRPSNPLNPLAHQEQECLTHLYNIM